jgi:predicted Zn-dependent protease
MTVRVLPVAFTLVLAASGCVSDDQKLTTVSTSPFGRAGTAQASKVAHAPATEEVANRVWKLGGKIVAANPQIKLPVHFQTIGDPKPEIFHIVQREGSQVFITQGLVNQCKNDDQLAALLCQELGEIASEQAAQARSARVVATRPPLLTPHVGNDNGGTFGPADGTDQIILAHYEKERRESQQALPAPPAPDKLARVYLQNAGFNPKEFDAAAPLLRAARQNDTWEQQMTGKLGR